MIYDKNDDLGVGGYVSYIPFLTKPHTDTPPSPVEISGSTKTSSGTLISGVTVTFSSGGGTATTDGSGNYSITVPNGYTGTATPSKTGYTFDPASKTYSNVTAPKTGENYMGNPDVPVLSVSPGSRDVPKDAGITAFSVSNTGTGTMTWDTSVTGGWLTITSGDSGTNSGTINCSFAANTSTSARTATVRVTATGATGSPVDVTVTQAPAQPVLSVTPSNQAVSKDAGTTTFGVSNTGTGTMPWTAAVTPASTWLSITSGASGTDTGTISCSFTANTSTSSRTATIRVTATG
ncbi:MAG: BACON domain-containing carbohydrate-binding protein, partial [Deltaproteobacteria bacterium]